jgi:hypothetical protein
MLANLDCQAASNTFSPRISSRLRSSLSAIVRTEEQQNASRN